MRSAFVGGVLAALVAAPAAAQGPKAEDFIDYRQSAFTLIAWEFGPMKAMVKGDMPFSAEAFRQHAENLAVLSHLPMKGFAPGTANGETKAKAAVWDQQEEFRDRMEKFQQAAVALVDASTSGSQEAMKARFLDTAKTCKACHKEFKSK